MIKKVYFCNIYQQKMNITIDIGNTWTKIVSFENDQPIEEKSCLTAKLTDMKEYLCQKTFQQGALSCVAQLKKETLEMLNNLPYKMLSVNGNTPVFLHNHYKSPFTMGSDRLAAIAGAVSLYPGKDLFVIDAGTCITLDFIDKNLNYMGGNISPGISMRLQMLHTCTGKLPLVKQDGTWNDLGQDTETAIRSGVLAGVRGEILDTTARIKKKHPNLYILLTGGDAKRIEEFLDTENIKTENLLVAYGLNIILKYNNKN